jgi:hypothetical protein
MKEEDILLQQIIGRIAYVFKSLRIKSGSSSYEHFAFKHDFPRAQYWRVEDGKSNLTLRTIARLLAIHNLSINEFANLLGQEPPRET